MHATVANASTLTVHIGVSVLQDTPWMLQEGNVRTKTSAGINRSFVATAPVATSSAGSSAAAMKVLHQDPCRFVKI
nr:unnamed protein product [Callosobruchus chinensis]